MFRVTRSSSVEPSDSFLVKGLLLAALYPFCFPCATVSAQQAQPSNETLRGLDPRVMDIGADPCVDFAKYACGNFNKLYPIRQDEMASSPTAGASAQIRDVLKQILVKDVSPGAHTSEQRLLGDYYTACLNVPSVNAKGLMALKPLLSAIDAMSDRKQLPGLLAQIQRMEGNSVFSVYAFADEMHVGRTIVALDQTGFGLQTAENYGSTDSKAVALRQQYSTHIAHLLALSGEDSSYSHKMAGNIITLESQLVKNFPTPAARRDPVARYHAFTLEELEHLTPTFDWKGFFAGLGVEGPVKVNVWSTIYIQSVAEVMRVSDLETLRSFFRWRVLSSIPGVDLPTTMDDEKFSFEGKVMLGLQQQAPRERRCLSSIRSDISGPVATAVIGQMFSVEEIQTIDQLARGVETALAREIDGLPWMDQETKLQAKRKANAITNNIVRLDPWKGWANLTVTRDDALGNYLKATQLQTQRTFQRVGQPADKTELSMSPIYTGAYWTNTLLTMNVNAGAILPPAYDVASTNAINYGHLGSVVGHEISHGFDNSGAHYDATGSLVDWWSAGAKRKFDEKAACFVREYAKFEDGGLHVNGELTLGENIADNGGLRLAYLAMLEDAAERHLALTAKTDGFTPEQQFFIAFGQEYCGATRPERERVLMLTDPHSLDQFRVNGAVQNMPQFGNAFSCKVGQPMMPSDICQIW